MTSKIILISLLIGVGLVNGLYEDQIGKFDWLQKYFGPIRFILNDLNQPKRIIIGTEDNVVGAINSNNGAILYRNILESNGKLLYLGNYEDRTILTISGHDKQIKLRSFAATNGVEKKEWILQEDKITHSAEYNSKVYLVDAKSKFPESVSITTVQLTAGPKDEDDTGLEGRYTKLGTAVVKTGLQLQSNKWFCDFAIPYFICVTGKTVSVFEIEKETVKHHDLEVDGDILEMSTSGSSDLTVVAFKGKGFVKLFHIQNEKGNIVLNQIQYPSTSHFVTVSQSKVDGEQILFISRLETSHLIQMDAYSLKLEKDPSLSIQIRAPMIISSLALTKGFCQNSQCGIVGFTKDEFFFGTKLDGKQVAQIEWSRQESLANVLAIEMVDFPSEIGPTWNPYLGQMDIFTSFVSRIKYEIEALLTGESFYSSSNDRFGLRKVIVFVTSVGKVLGMDSATGQILYTFILPEFGQFTGRSVFLYIQRPAKYAPLKPLASVLYPSSVSGLNTILFPFNPVEGKHLDEPQTFPPIVQSQILLHGTEATNFLKPVLLLDSNGIVHTYPTNVPNVANSYFFLAEKSNNPKLRGFTIRPDETKNKLRAKRLWDLNLGSSELLGVYGKLPCEKIHSQGRVLPDRSVSYKYMNPNMVVVVTSEPENGNINLFFVDAVSGAVIHSFWHKKCRGPVHVVHSEHFIIYSLYNEKFRRYEINSVELYEGQAQSNSTAFSSFAAPNVNPIIVKQAYIFPTGIQYMAHTRTEKGITNKDILIGLPTGGVLELPRMILQPRLSQQHYLTQVQDEDGNFHSMPYIPELPIPADMLINYNQSVRRIHGIKAWPTRLESTCLVLVYGNDLFYTKVSPSKTFDVLKDDFDHLFITVVLAALCLGAYLTKRLSARKQLDQAWR